MCKLMHELCNLIDFLLPRKGLTAERKGNLLYLSKSVEEPHKEERKYEDIGNSDAQ